MLNLSGDFINNASINRQDVRTRNNQEDDSYLNQIGEEILTVLQGSAARRGPQKAEDMNLSEFLANQVLSNPSNQFNPIGEQVEVTQADDSGYWEAFGDWYA